MFVWCAILFFLGIAAFMDAIFNYGEIFRQINSVLFMLVSLALLIRTTVKMKAGKFEEYENRVKNLERELRAIKDTQEKEPVEY
jgi:ABC-type Na+ efflux pump permease subunit